jgi:hypothetical protein
MLSPTCEPHPIEDLDLIPSSKPTFEADYEIPRLEWLCSYFATITIDVSYRPLRHPLTNTIRENFTSLRTGDKDWSPRKSSQMAVEAGRHSRERRVGGGQSALNIEDDEDRTGGRRGSKHGVYSSPELEYRRVQGRKRMHPPDEDHNDRNDFGHRSVEQESQEGKEEEAA